MCNQFTLHREFRIDTGVFFLKTPSANVHTVHARTSAKQPSATRKVPHHSLAFKEMSTGHRYSVGTYRRRKPLMELLVHHHARRLSIASCHRIHLSGCYTLSSRTSCSAKLPCPITMLVAAWSSNISGSLRT